MRIPHRDGHVVYTAATVTMDAVIQLLLLLLGVLQVHSQSPCSVTKDFVTIKKGIAEYVKPAVGRVGHCCPGESWCSVVSKMSTQKTVSYNCKAIDS